MKLLGLTGLAGSGKDAVAKHLFCKHGWSRTAFADPLKQAATHIFGLSINDFYDREKKEQVNDYWNISPREMLQYLGTEAVRGTFGEDVWVRRWHLSYTIIKDTDNVVVTDVRTPTEADWLRRQGGKIVEVRRPGAGLSGASGRHVSESGLTAEWIDGVIHNDRGLEALGWIADQVLAKVFA